MRTFISILLLLCSASLFSKVRLSGETNFPVRNMYIPGEKIEIRFRVDGLCSGERTELLVDVKDWQERSLKTYQLPVEGDAKGVWRHVLRDLPNREWGYYRVYAKLSNGETLPKRGTRPSGFLPYAIVPDPDSRLLPAEGECVFGFHTSYISPWIGARTVMRGLEPTEEQYKKRKAGQRERLNDIYQDRPWLTYSHTAFVGVTDPFRFWTPEQREKYSKVVHPGIKARMFIGREGERLYRQSVEKIAASARFQMENNSRMNYQPMWEPNICFTPDEILRMPRDEMLCVIRGCNILKLKKLDYTKHPMSREIRKISVFDYAPHPIKTPESKPFEKDDAFDTLYRMAKPPDKF